MERPKKFFTFTIRERHPHEDQPVILDGSFRDEAKHKSTCLKNKKKRQNRNKRK